MKMFDEIGKSDSLKCASVRGQLYMIMGAFWEILVKQGFGRVVSFETHMGQSVENSTHPFS